MPFVLRPYRRFPVQCFVTYTSGPFSGIGTLWNLSMSGYRFSGDLPLRVGEECALTVMLPNEQNISADAVVRWVRQNEFGVETRTIDHHAKERLWHYVQRLLKEPLVIVP